MKHETHAKFFELIYEFKEKLRKAIMVGPASTINDRIDAVLDGFVTQLITLCDDEAVKRAKLYVDGFRDALPPQDE